jgi:hypothetical protein
VQTRQAILTNYEGVVGETIPIVHAGLFYLCLEASRSPQRPDAEPICLTSASPTKRGRASTILDRPATLRGGDPARQRSSRAWKTRICDLPGGNACACFSDRPEDVIEFEPNRRHAFAAMIGQKPALVFVPYETEDNSADAAEAEAERKGVERD